MELSAAKLPSNMGLNIQIPDTTPEHHMHEEGWGKDIGDTSHL